MVERRETVLMDGSFGVTVRVLGSGVNNNNNNKFKGEIELEVIIKNFFINLFYSHFKYLN